MSTTPPDNKEARALLEKASKAQSRFFSFGTAKYEEAAELYVRAGNLFKASKQCLFSLSFPNTQPLIFITFKQSKNQPMRFWKLLQPTHVQAAI